MKNLKKVLALVTMFTMLLSVAVSAGALYPDVDDNASYAEAVETLNVLGIMIGDEKGNFNPDASITRAETAAIVTRMKNLGNAATGSTNFSDVAADHWAAGYINLAEQSGIINGYGDGTFGPSDAVTYEQVIKMIVAALGRTPEAESKGGYPSGYMIVAAQEDITAGVTVTAGAEAPRAAVARLVFNALEVPIMEQDGFKTGEESFKVYDGSNGTTLKTLLKNYLKVNKYEGVIDSSYLSNGKIDAEATITIACTKINEVSYKAGEEESVTLYEGGTDAAALVGYNVSAYAQLNEDDDMVLLGVAKRASKNDVLVLDATLIEEVTADGINFYPTESASKTDSIDVNFDTATYLFNGSKGKSEVDNYLDTMGTDAEADGVLTLISNDGDTDDYEVLSLKQAFDEDNYVVGAIDAEEMTLEARNGDAIDIDMDDEAILVKFFKADGTAAEFADIAEGNTLTIYKNSSETILSVYISDVTVEGKVTEKSTIKGADAYKIGDNNYTTLTGINVGDEGIFYVNAEGVIVDKVATATAGTYAYLYKALETSDIDGSTVELKYLTSEGVWETNTLASKVTVVNSDGTNGTLLMADVPYNAEDDTDDTEDVETEDKVEALLANFMEYNAKNVLADAAEANRLFQFKVNSEGKINYLYLGTNGGADYISVDASATDKSYDADNKKIGKIFLNDETKVFSVKGTGAPAKESDIVLTKASSFFIDGQMYTSVKAFDCENNIPAIVVAEGSGATILPGTNLLVITRVSQTASSTGGSITKIYGLQEGVEVSGELSEDGVDFKDKNGDDYKVGTADKDVLVPGDVVIFNLDAKGTIDQVEVVMAYADADDVATNSATAFYAEDGNEVNGMAPVNMFGYVGKKDNGLLYLYDKFGDDKEALLEDNNDVDSDVSIATSISGVNVYEITVKADDEPTFDVISMSKIKATTANFKEAHWAFVRVYDDSVVDIVVYKTTTPKAVVATPTFEIVNGKVELDTATAGATIKYTIDGGATKTYGDVAIEVAEDATLKAWAVKDNWTTSDELVVVPFPSAPVVD